MARRRLAAPRGDVRPTTDRVREAVFNILMTRIGGSHFLDLYAGSGAVGLEALSRGAAEVCWVESSRSALGALRANLTSLGVSGMPVRQSDVIVYLRRSTCVRAYDIIYADPPYADVGKGRSDPLHALLESILSGGWLASDGVFVYESSGRHTREETDDFPGWSLSVDRVYGRSRIRVLSQEK